MTAPRFIHLRVHSAYSLLEGAIPVKKLPGALRGGGHAGGGADRHRQPLRGAGVLRDAGQGRRPADHRLPARPRLRRGRASRRPAAGAAAGRAARAGRGGLRQPDAALLGHYLDCGAALPHVTLDALAAHAEGPDLPDRRRRGPARRADPRGPRRAGPRAGRAAGRRSSPAGSTSRCSATRRTARRARRPRRRPSPGWSGSPTTSTCRWSPPTTSISRRPRCTRRTTR